MAEWTLELFAVTHVVCLGEALARLGKDRFDAVLLDLSLPDGYGLTTLRQVQAASPTTPVITLSGVSDQTLALLRLMSC